MASIASFKLNPAIFNQTLYTSVLKLWFTSYPTPPTGFPNEENKRWFGDDKALDANCKTVAGEALASLSPQAVELPAFVSFKNEESLRPSLVAPFLPEFADEARKPDVRERQEASLALCIMLDQMSRNVFRKEEQGVVFTHYDRLAQAISHEAAVRLRLDRTPPVVDSLAWRLFFYMPLEHSENLQDHMQVQALFRDAEARMKENKDEPAVKTAGLMYDSLLGQTDMIERFGRFPKRNEWLGREDTEEEVKWKESRSK